MGASRTTTTETTTKVSGDGPLTAAALRSALDEVPDEAVVVVTVSDSQLEGASWRVVATQRSR